MTRFLPVTATTGGKAIDASSTAPRGTSTDLQDGAGSPVKAAVAAKAALTDGAVIGPSHAERDARRGLR